MLLFEEEMGRPVQPGDMLNEGGLESAVNRPHNLMLYEGVRSAPVLAATLAYGIATAHAFRDGNKRVSFSAGAMLLDLNDMAIVAPAELCFGVWVSLAKKQMGLSFLTKFFVEYSKPIQDLQNEDNIATYLELFGALAEPT
ncbi:type II toxin-antitoxin system death-on-curing family toxin [Aureimonas psammosilenae]|uniref:type II toxin-antitoxin system death-on-curing family toxin n=1 Tax=Aureimonas psammosilenae TaxID=2495496 RepID=UPI00126089A5|nr:type II toxin-antitoxin system death-on-curing family toxin [Aureimonas psammosilenae]